MTAALKLKQIVANVASILAIELLTATHALDGLAPLETGHFAAKARSLVRKVVLPLSGDRAQAPDIAAVTEQVRRGEYAGVLREGRRSWPDSGRLN
jgi:histidine ammonia-lyase